MSRFKILGGRGHDRGRKVASVYGCGHKMLESV